jgi:hypothetical protein
MIAQARGLKEMGGVPLRRPMQDARDLHGRHMMR